MTERNSDYWYDNRHLLESGQIFALHDGSIVKLDRRVPGDGTQWYVASRYRGYAQNGVTVPASWAYEDDVIEPGDLRGDPLPADFDAVSA
jgi:hypothetical protein